LSIQHQIIRAANGLGTLIIDPNKDTRSESEQNYRKGSGSGERTTAPGSQDRLSRHGWVDDPVPNGLCRFHEIFRSTTGLKTSILPVGCSTTLTGGGSAGWAHGVGS
jgi:hypothetical protein